MVKKESKKAEKKAVVRVRYLFGSDAIIKILGGKYACIDGEFELPAINDKSPDIDKKRLEKVKKSPHMFKIVDENKKSSFSRPGEADKDVEVD